MLDTDTRTALTAIVTGQRDSLIRAEVLASRERTELERAVVAAIQAHGVSVDIMAEASGLRAEEIRALVARAS